MDKSKWEYKKLGEVCEVLDKFRKPVTKSDRVAGQYPYYGATGIQDYVADYIFDGRYLLLGEDGAKWGANENSAFIIEGKSWVNNHAHILKIDDSFMDIFVMYYLNHKDLSEYITGAVVPKLTQAAMLKIPVPNISIADQQRIVAELDCLNEMIALKQEQLKEFDKLAQSIFYDMFGDPVSNEKRWEKNKLDELYKVTSSKRILQSEWQDNGVPFYKVADIVNLIDGKTVVPSTFIKESTYNELMRQGLVPNSGDILITSRGTLGECYIVLEGDKFYFQDGMITWLSQKANSILSIYLKSVFGTKNFLDSLLHNANMSTVAYLSIGQLSKVQIPLPPLALQQQFAEKIQAIEAQKEFVKKSIAETQHLLDSRMDYYFN